MQATSVELETKISELERQVHELTAIVKGVDTATQGWEGEVLTVSDLRFTTKQPQVATLLSGWAPYTWLGTPNYTLDGGIRFYKMDHRVIVTIEIQGGAVVAGTVIGLLPAGYIPLVPFQMTVFTGGGSGRIGFSTNGQIESVNLPNNVTVVGRTVYLVA